MPDATYQRAHCKFLELGGAFVWVAYLAKRFKELIVDKDDLAKQANESLIYGFLRIFFVYN